jgi:hypothetical protein
MEKHLHTVERWDAQYLKDNGKKVQLGTWLRKALNYYKVTVN